jgi:cellulose synthase/poly-beta-1,6-N-acetylglucosamine synthase-like glycosyltransferase
VVILFWFLVALLALHFFLFPLCLFLLSRFRAEPSDQESPYPTVSLIIAAYNEERVIAKKLKNSLALEYASENLEIIVVSDGSTDNTPRIVEAFREKGVTNLFVPQRQGKAAAINRAVGQARGEILLLSDANCFYDAQAVRSLARHFSNSEVGGVTGRKSIRKQEERESSRGDGAFWKVESCVKSWESRIGSVPTADGEIFALRRSVFVPLPEDTINDDTFLTFQIVRRGLRVIYEPAAVSEEFASQTLADDFRVKARMVCGGMQTLKRNARFLFPPRSFFAFQFLVHKGLRHFMPLLLVGLFFTNIGLVALGGETIYRLALAAQGAFYTVALAGAAWPKRDFIPSALYFPLYFCAMNTAALVGIGYYLRQAPLMAIWKKASR